jgi:hypothetical protein
MAIRVVKDKDLDGKMGKNMGKEKEAIYNATKELEA